VSGAIYTVPIFFYCSGFLQTYSFCQKVDDNEMNLGKYYFRKIFRYMPLNIASGLFIVKIMPYAGNGPVWNNFATLVEPCNDKFWTNVLWISNL
jgi:peptidoglycan/LPS O-acetylase OafA/YrhL